MYVLSSKLYTLKYVSFGYFSIRKPKKICNSIIINVNLIPKTGLHHQKKLLYN